MAMAPATGSGASNPASPPSGLVQVDVVKEDAVDKFGATPLISAALSGSLDVIKYLCEETGANTEAGDRYGNTALHMAAAGGKLAAVKYLCEDAKANVEALDNYKNTPLHSAANAGSLEVVRYLCVEAKANKEARERTYGNTPLHTAVKWGKLDVVRYLCEEAGADKRSVNNDGMTPLSLARLERQIRVVNYLGGCFSAFTALVCFCCPEQCL